MNETKSEYKKLREKWILFGLEMENNLKEFEKRELERKKKIKIVPIKNIEKKPIILIKNSLKKQFYEIHKIKVLTKFNHECPLCKKIFYKKVKKGYFSNSTLRLELFFCSENCKLEWIYKKQELRDKNDN